MNLASRAINKAARLVRFHSRKRDALGRGFAFYEPNYLYIDRLDAESVVVDVGCGHEAEFSKFVIEQYAARAFGVDPTRKHAPFLAELEKDSGGLFKHVSAAVAATAGSLTFHESMENESGSVLTDHVNVQADQITSYEVDAVTLHALLARIGTDRAEFLKLDLEGAEYDLLGSVTREDVAPFAQIFVEFHHHAFDRFTESDTARTVARLEGMGLQSITLDDHNFLFYWRR